ncbi:uncharacterized protein LOC100378087 [Saccoglossus kowalevskii]|uniref:Stoned B-like protein-like n=1 Tax=Saccoglossus kowalevskii TaxID=10224 RepID=A0ABM0GX24_SACKO|nr:PREDICTED: putative stoned B-like protein-like [Saccoglossus kowalevskii]
MDVHDNLEINQAAESNYNKTRGVDDDHVVGTPTDRLGQGDDVTDLLFKTTVAENGDETNIVDKIVTVTKLETVRNESDTANEKVGLPGDGDFDAGTSGKKDLLNTTRSPDVVGIIDADSDSEKNKIRNTPKMNSSGDSVLNAEKDFQAPGKVKDDKKAKTKREWTSFVDDNSNNDDFDPFSAKYMVGMATSTVQVPSKNRGSLGDKMKTSKEESWMAFDNSEKTQTFTDAEKTDLHIITTSVDEEPKTKNAEEAGGWLQFDDESPRLPARSSLTPQMTGSSIQSDKDPLGGSAENLLADEKPWSQDDTAASTLSSNRGSIAESQDSASQHYGLLDSTPSSKRGSIGEMLTSTSTTWATFEEGNSDKNRDTVSLVTDEDKINSKATEPEEKIKDVSSKEKVDVAKMFSPDHEPASPSVATTNTVDSVGIRDEFQWVTPQTGASNVSQVSSASSAFDHSLMSLPSFESTRVSAGMLDSTAQEQQVHLQNSFDQSLLPNQSGYSSASQNTPSTPSHWISFDDGAQKKPKPKKFFGSSFQPEQVEIQHTGPAGNPFKKELLASQYQHSFDQTRSFSTQQQRSLDHSVDPSTSFTSHVSASHVSASMHPSPYNPFQKESAAVDQAIFGTQAAAISPSPQQSSIQAQPNFGHFDGNSSSASQFTEPPKSPGNPFRVEKLPQYIQPEAAAFVSDLTSDVNMATTQPETPIPLYAATTSSTIPVTMPVTAAATFEPEPVQTSISSPPEAAKEITPKPDAASEVHQYQDEYPPESYDLLKGWPLQLRTPDRKTITGSRYWRPVHIRLIDTNVLQLYNEANPLEPFRELPLQSCYMFSVPKLQAHDTRGKIHTIKLEYVSYKEKKKFGKHVIDHVDHRAELLKIGSTNYDLFGNFIRAVNDTLMKLPSYRDRGTTYRQDAVTIEVTDMCRVKLTMNGETDKISTMVHIHCLAFVTGMPDCVIGLNDVQRQGLEVVSRQDIIPHRSDQWIKMENVELHSCVDKDKFVSERFIEFHPLDACTFELMRFQIRPDKKQDLPLTLKTVVSGEQAHIELRADVLIPGYRSKKSMQQNPCENIMICFPLPENWIPMFRVEKKFGYSSVKSTTKKSGRIKKGSLCPGLMEVSVGSAKYEHAYKSLVWRIPRLPEKNTDPHTTHIFMCRMDLTSDREIPSTYGTAKVEYTMPHTTASKAAIRSITVANERCPDKLVRYKAIYKYEVEIEQNFHFTAVLDDEEPRQCIQQ